jgi:hypothetical protein
MINLHHILFLFTELQRPIGFDLPHDEKLSDFDNRIQLIFRKHLTILVWWSIFNCIGSLIALFMLQGSAYYFWMMCGTWGVIDFAVAIVFFYHIFYQKSRKGSAYKRLVVQNHVEQMMFLNVGIDVAYIFVGFWLREHSFICAISYPDLWLGFGWAIVMQGLFLLAQDITFLSLHRRNFRKAQPFLLGLLSPQTNSLPPV